MNRSGGEAAWPEPPEAFVHQLADEIGARRRPARPEGSRRFRLSFALVAGVALLLPLAAFADQAGDNLARRDDSVEVELVATDDDDDGGGGGGGDDSETSVAGAYDNGGDSDSESSGHAGQYDNGHGEDSESDDGGGAAPAAGGGGGDDSESDDGAAANQTQLPPLAGTQQAPAPAPAAPAGGGDDSEDSD